MDAIVYTTNTGTTRAYAELLAQESGLPCIEASQASKQLARGTNVVYMGWVKAGTIMGYRRVAKRFNVRALCGVGMWPASSQDSYVRDRNHIAADMPLFTLQGGICPDKLHGLNRLMMQITMWAVGKGVAEKSDPTPEELDLLELVRNPGSRVNSANLGEVASWLNRENHGNYKNSENGENRECVA